MRNQVYNYVQKIATLTRIATHQYFFVLAGFFMQVKDQ